jgi:putative ABC transport system substrate-binding protein
VTDRRAFFAATSASLLVLPLRVLAQRDARVRTIGILGVSHAYDSEYGLTATLIHALAELGWVEGRNVAYVFRWSEQRNDRLPELAAELVRLNVDVIVVESGTTGTQAAKAASGKIPIVMSFVADPVKFGLIESFAHPGGNVTGVARPLVDWGKWLELTRECVPAVTRIAVIANVTNIVYADYVAQNEDAARRLGLQLQMLPVRRAEDFAGAFAAITRKKAGAIVVGPDYLLVENMPSIIDFALSQRLPLITAARTDVRHGALMSSSVDGKYVRRRAATYVDKILRGAKPADLPVEQPSRFELIVNMRTAKALGITVPQSLLLRADEVIE